jgi:hypothetical protein
MACWILDPVSDPKSDGGVPLQIGAYSLAIQGVFVSTILLQRGQRNTCSMACCSLTRNDRDHAISILQAAQIGEAKFSIDRLNRSIGPYPYGDAYHIDRSGTLILHRYQATGTRNLC